ncbi:hypothetical protein [Xanthomonas oryzae]|uniref:Uncharacterized protein n=1 Tax=Xanthomonas oryzae pv. leersiae TaxID=3112258 RepID=A0AAJ6KKY1_9XANT|nr:hypothetical protein [Xanthomonas oryzae]WIX05818.1 hypothetical protein QN060_16820 [Xanthomonas oryzae pv. oryzae]
MKISSVENGEKILIGLTLLEDFALPAESRSILSEQGLPGAMEPSVLGLAFVPPFTHLVGRERYLVIAKEGWGDDLWIALRDDGQA